MKSDFSLDCYGLFCPVPIIKTAQKIKELKIGQILEIISTDEGIKSDLPNWCRSVGQEFLGMEQEEGLYKGYVRKTKD